MLNTTLHAAIRVKEWKHIRKFLSVFKSLKINNHKFILITSKDYICPK